MKAIHAECIDGNSRLYTCWLAMKSRATKRGDSCNVCPEWQVAANFIRWAKDNGYTEDKVLGRFKDVGDYSPTNARWITWAESEKDQAEAEAVTFYGYKLKGEAIVITNMNQYCKDHELNRSHMVAIRNPNRERKSHKGHTYEPISRPAESS